MSIIRSYGGAIRTELGYDFASIHFALALQQAQSNAVAPAIPARHFERNQTQVCAHLNSDRSRSPASKLDRLIAFARKFRECTESADAPLRACVRQLFVNKREDFS